MFNTLRSKMILLITVIMAITGGTIMYFTHHDVGEAMLQAEEKSARNVLELVELNIRAGYNRLISDKIEILTRLKTELRDTTRMAGLVLTQYRSLADRGVITEAQATDLARQWLHAFEFDKGDLFILDENGVIFGSSNGRLEGVSMSDVHDLKGRVIAEKMRYDVLPPEGDGAVFVWPHRGQDRAARNMAYFLPIAGWKWTLAGVIDFENIEAESQKRLDAIIAVLNKTFDKIRIAESGYVFLFGGDNKLLIAPPGFDADEGAVVDMPHLARIAAAAKEDGQSVRYIDPFMPGGIKVQALSTYFKAFDWYPTVVVPVNEIQQPAEALVTEQSFIIGLVFLGGLLSSFLLVAKISSPLNTLTTYAKTLSAQDFTKEWTQDNRQVRALAANHKDEVGRLARAFAVMETELRKKIRHAIESTAEKERVEKEAVKEAARAKDEFLANMSHEIRTPIHGMLGMTDLLLEGVLADKQRRFAETIRGSGEALLTIINDILDFSKVEAAKVRIESTVFDLGDLVERVVEQFAEPTERKGIELSCAVAPECYGMYRGDPARLRQILVNLCGNAVKFTNVGEIYIRVQIAGQLGQDCQVQFEVTDTGIGMTPEQQEHIFDPFAQADTSTTRRYGGTGLGLAISKRLVDLMDGDVGVRSAVNEGSTFSFCVPLTKEEATEGSGVVEGRKPVVSRLLLVQNASTSRDILCERIASFGTETVDVSDVDEARAQLRVAADRGVPFDLLLVDHGAGGRTGYESAEMLRKDGTHSRTRVVLMVPMVGDELLERRAAQIGAHILVKPVRQLLLEDLLFNGSRAPARMRHQRGASTDEEVGPINAKILVAEDNELNQELIREMLKRAVRDVTIVENGKRALEALEREHFDLILMDCQMPEVDGYAATRHIREREAEDPGARRIPIVALTANAMAGDHDECIAAGMDDYLSKPFKRSQLLTLLKKWIDPEVLPPVGRDDEGHDGVASPHVSRDAAAPIELDRGVIDSIRAIEEDDEGALLGRLIDIYTEQSPRLLAEIRAGLEAGDAARVRNAVHTLKSTSANLGARELADLCRTLEEKARTEDLEGSDALLAGIEGILPNVYDALERERVAPRDEETRSALG